MPTAVIRAVRLCKTYSVTEREEGLRAAINNLIHRKTKEIKAVDQISFDVEPGEVVGFLGPNGAGKTTTLKCLSGLLHPTQGEVKVLGYIPARREKAFLRQITLMMGQRFQLQWDLPAIDSYKLCQAIYQIPEKDYKQIRDELIDLLEVSDLVFKPVRNLSLGERMKCEMIASLLHSPRVLFLDEPTLGLDVVMQRRIRTFIADYNRRNEATVLLTSHYMADVEALCKRVMIIHNGKLLFDGALSQLVDCFSSWKSIQVTLKDPNVDLSCYGEVKVQDNLRVVLRVSRRETPAVTARLLAEIPVTDLVVEDPPIEEVVESAFMQFSHEQIV